MNTGFSFTLEKQYGTARAGTLITPHGIVKTPVYMPVGTVGSVKALTSEDVSALGASIILGNTYHLYLRPGEAIVRQLGGIHSFMRWDKPILTDSGGYQVSSLGLFKSKGSVKLARIDDDGVTFKSFLDGTMHRFTPEKAIEIQEALGSDIVMAFDEATPDMGERYAREAMQRTHSWLIRCKAHWLSLEKQKTTQPPQALFGIIQGGNYKAMRRESTDFVLSQDLPGVAIGGGTIGQNVEQTEENISWIRDMLPKDMPIYAMGVGVGPRDVIGAIVSGVDMFDCVAPTKLARTGYLYHGKLEGNSPTTWRFASEYPKERINISKAEFTTDSKPIDENCDCYTCVNGFSRAYLRHLFRSSELVYYRLASIHNLRVMIRLCEDIRAQMISAVIP